MPLRPVTLIFLLNALNICSTCSPCFTLCVRKSTSSSTEICPVVCDKQEKSDLDTLQGSTIVISVRAVNKSCEARYALTLTHEPRISVDAGEISGNATATDTEHQVNIQCGTGTFRADVTISANVSISTTNVHQHFSAKLQRTCSTDKTDPPPPPDSSDSNNLAGQELLIVVICSSVGGVMIITIIILTAIYLRKQTVSPESGSEVGENLRRRVTMTFPTPTEIETKETEFYRPFSTPNFIIPHELEFPFDNLNALNAIGKTTFGRLYTANARDLLEGEALTSVLLRMLHEDVDSEVTRGFLKQVEKMASLVHDNIVQLLGVCSREIQPCMIFECPDGGNLHEILKSTDPDANISTPEKLPDTDLLSFGVQVADAMTYLEKRRFVHRDLATRNCHVTQQKQIKLLPFGVIRPEDEENYYKVGHQTMLPVRWLPHNTITHGSFTTQTDIWSFGVFLWELYSYGRQPYEGQTNEEVVWCLQAGELLQQPDECPNEVYDLMLQCWREKTTFMALHAAIRLMQV